MSVGSVLVFVFCAHFAAKLAVRALTLASLYDDFPIANPIFFILPDFTSMRRS